MSKESTFGTRRRRAAPVLVVVVAARVISSVAMRALRAHQRGASQRPDDSRSLLVVSQAAVPLDMPGITRHVELASLLRQEGWRTTILTSAFHTKLRAYQRSPRLGQPVVEDIDGVRFCWLYSTPYQRNDWRRYVNMASFLVAAVFAGSRDRRPYVVIGSSPHLLAALGAWIVARWHQVPFLLEVRDVWPDTLVQMGLRNPAIVWPLSVLERFLYARAHRIIVLTQGIEDRINAKGISHSKLVLIPNAAPRPAPLDDDQRAAMRRKLGWEDKVVAIYAGAHGPANDLEMVVEAARLLEQETNILVALIGDGSTKPQLVEQATGLKNIIFYDPLPKREIMNVLRAGDMALLTLRRTDVFTGARPNKLFDYMAAGLPIISTVPGEAWHLIDAAGAGVYAEPEDPSALAWAVRTLARDADGRTAMGRRGHCHVLQAHTREDTAEQLAAVLADFVSDRGGIGAR